MTKILFTTVIKPFGINSDDCTDRTQPELFHGQVTLAQDIFSIRAFYGGFGLEYMALNIKPGAVVLNYPSEKEFIKELKRGYDYVGITYVMCTHEKMVKMCAMVREHSPQSKIILGGYGVMIPGAETLGDYVCREEGIGFMRKLLGEDLNAPIKHPIIPEVKKVLGYPVNTGSIILAGLGCPNGCDFCTTSHFFNRKHIPLLATGKDIWNVIQEIDKKLHTRLFGIMEEDFLLYKERVMQLSEYTRRELKRPVRLAGFSSIRSIKNYDPVFLAEMGIESLWIGIESKSSLELREKHTSIKVDIQGKETDISSYSKMDNADIVKIVNDLHKVGINTLVSMIVGLEHHTKELIQSDLDWHLNLFPTLSQFMLYTAIPGTPLYECLNKEGRIIPNLPWYKIDGFYPNFIHKNLSYDELHEQIMHCFKVDYERLGPTAFRFVEIAMMGYKNFAESKVPIQAARAKCYGDYCKLSYPLFDVGIKYAVNDKIANKLIKMKEEIVDLFGRPTLLRRAQARLAFTSARINRELIDRGEWVLQPVLERVVYGKHPTSPQVRKWKLMIPHRYAK